MSELEIESGHFVVTLKTRAEDRHAQAAVDITVYLHTAEDALRVAGEIMRAAWNTFPDWEDLLAGKAGVAKDLQLYDRILQAGGTKFGGIYVKPASPTRPDPVGRWLERDDVQKVSDDFLELFTLRIAELEAQLAESEETRAALASIVAARVKDLDDLQTAADALYNVAKSTYDASAETEDWSLLDTEMFRYKQTVEKLAAQILDTPDTL